MPIYEYACQDCARHFEIMQKMSDEPLKVCEACGGKLEKQWSQTGFQFKGAGWYVTDYAKPKADSSDAGKSGDDAKSSDKSSDQSGDKGGSDKGGEAKTETKSDTKPEAKSEGAKTETKSDSPGAASSDTSSSTTTPTPANAKS